MYRLLIFLMLAFLTLGMICLAEKKKPSSPLKIGKIPWMTDYDEALKLAQKEKKPLWLHFGEHPG